MRPLLNHRNLAIIAASIAAGAVLGAFTSAADGFFGALGIATLLREFMEQQSSGCSTVVCVTCSAGKDDRPARLKREARERCEPN